MIDLARGHIPAWGTTLTQQAMRAADCLGFATRPPGDCNVKHRLPSQLPAEGYSYEAQQPPLGYLPYVVAYDLAPGSPHANVVATRLGGWAWTLLAAVLVAALGVTEDLRWPSFLTLSSCSLLSPVFVHAASTITNDASGVAAGALACLVAGVARRRKRPLVLLGLAVGLAIGFAKGLDFAAPLVLLVAQVLRERPWSHPRPDRRELLRRLSTALAMVAGSVAAYLGWIVIQVARSPVPASVVLQPLLGSTHESAFRLDAISLGLQGMFQLFTAFIVDAPLYFVWDVAVFGSLIGVLTVARRGQVSAANRALAAAVLTGMAVLAVVYPVVLYVQGHYDQPAVGRYAVPLLPIIGLVLACSLRRRALIAVGVVLPLAAGVSQLITGNF